MPSYIVTEGPADVIMLRALLNGIGRQDIRVVEAGGKSSAISLGTSLALDEDNRVAVLVDADTTDKRRLAEQQGIFRDLLKGNVTEEVCRLFLAVPTLEEDLFTDIDTFVSVFDLKLAPDHLGSDRHSLHEAAKILVSKPHERRLKRFTIPELRPGAAEAITDHGLMKEVTAFLPASEHSAVPATN